MRPISSGPAGRAGEALLRAFLLVLAMLSAPVFADVIDTPDNPFDGSSCDGCASFIESGPAILAAVFVSAWIAKRR